MSVKSVTHPESRAHFPFGRVVLSKHQVVMEDPQPFEMSLPPLEFGG